MSRRFSVVLLSIVVILATLFTAVPSPVLAQDGSGPMFGARPSDTSKAFFTFTMKAGESVDDKVLLVNNSTNMTLNLNITQVTGETGLTGGISVKPR